MAHSARCIGHWLEGPICLYSVCCSSHSSSHSSYLIKIYSYGHIYVLQCQKEAPADHVVFVAWRGLAALPSCGACVAMLLLCKGCVASPLSLRGISSLPSLMWTS